MHETGVRAYRAIRQKDARDFLGSALTYVAEETVVSMLNPWFERRTLGEHDLERICDREGTFFERYDNAESYVLDLPTVPGGYDSEDRAYMESVYGSGMEIDAPYICELADADLVGPNAVPIKNGRYVYEHFFDSIGLLTTSCLLAMSRGRLPRNTASRRCTTSLKSAVSLVGPWNYNYTHWFQDFLARLEGLAHYERATSEEPAILIPTDASGWMLDALRTTGVAPDRWVEWDTNRMQVDKYIVPAIRREDRGNSPNRRILYSPKGVEWLRERIKANIEPERTVNHADRIYISRSNALTRRVVNEHETMELLSRWGFERYHTEMLSFAEQVTLFSDAEAMISSHGSGLMNQIWAEDATVMEIFGPKQGITAPASEYYYAETLGHDYGCVQGRTVGVDVKADLDALKELLELML